MTTLQQEFETCAHCGWTGEFTTVTSTNAFGSPDLDLRPPPAERHILSHAVRECPDCGLCASRLSEIDGLETSILGTAGYAATMNDPSFPPLACRFRAQAQLAQAAGNHARAGSSQLRAAWACDDAGDDFASGAAQCRRELLATLDLLHEAGETLADDKLTDAVMELDLLRRSGDFDAVVARSGTLSGQDLPELLAQIVAFERERAEAQDRAGYTVRDAMEAK